MCVTGCPAAPEQNAVLPNSPVPRGATRLIAAGMLNGGGSPARSDSSSGRLATAMTEPRWRRRLCTTLLWLHATLLGAAVPVTLLGLLLSTWEGGDLAWKHRFATWAPLAVAGQAAGTVLLVLAAVAVTRERPDSARLTWIAAALVGVLAAGWGAAHRAESGLHLRRQHLADLVDPRARCRRPRPTPPSSTRNAQRVAAGWGFAVGVLVHGTAMLIGHTHESRGVSHDPRVPPVVN